MTADVGYNLWSVQSIEFRTRRGDPIATEQDRLSLALPYIWPRRALHSRHDVQSRMEGRESRRNRKEGGGGGFYSGKFSATTSGFILKY